MQIDDFVAVVVRPMKLLEEDGMDKLVNCDPDCAELFCIYLEAKDGELHFPESLGILGEFEVSDPRVAHMTASWLSNGLMHMGGAQ